MKHFSLIWSVIFALSLSIQVSDVAALSVDSSTERYLHFREQVEKLKKSPDDAALREWIIENSKNVNKSGLYSEEAVRLNSRADALIAKAVTITEIKDAAAVYKQALELAPWDRAIYSNLGLAFQKIGDLAHAVYSADSESRDICEPDMRQTAEAIMAWYHEAGNYLKLSLSNADDQVLQERNTLMSINKNLLTSYRLKYGIDRECCQGCRGIKPKELPLNR